MIFIVIVYCIPSYLLKNSYSYLVIYFLLLYVHLLFSIILLITVYIIVIPFNKVVLHVIFSHFQFILYILYISVHI